MNTEKLQKRDSSLDIVRIVAVFTVLSVHFFLHNGFYSQPVNNWPMYIMTGMRTLFSICVPMFMMLTGYLMSHKKLSKSYYKGIAKTLVVFVLITIVCMVYKAVHNHEVYRWQDFIFDTLDFTGANYSWYIEMYIGLFLIAPFLNLAYHKLETRNRKLVLIWTMIFLTVIPTLLNIYNFESLEWWGTPTSSDEFAKLCPAWWTGIYPITFYFTGCYVREYGIKLKTKSMLALLAVSLFLFTCFNIFRSYNVGFKSGTYVYWSGFEPYVLTVLIFTLLTRIKTQNLNNGAKFVLWKLSDLALGIYLLSYIFDEMIYAELNKAVPIMTDRLPYYFVTVPLCFICAAISSLIINIIAKYIIYGFQKLVEFIKAQRERPDKKKWQTFLFICLLGGGLIFSIWKLNFGFGGNDEAFYLTIPQRFLMGDAPIADEWHLSQLSGFLLMPFVWLYTTIFGSTDGIIFAARIVYVIFHAAVSIMMYLRLKKYGCISVFACALFFLYVPYNIMAMNYDSMGLDFVALTGVVMSTISHNKKLPMILSGVTFAAAVLCSPYLAAVYLLFALCVLVHIIIKKRNTSFMLKSSMFAPKTFLWFTVGVCAMAAVFLIFALPRVSISEIIKNLPYLMSDPEHPSLTFAYKFNSFFSSIFNYHANFKMAVYAYLVMAFVMAIDKKRKLHRSVYLIITVGVVGFCYVMMLPTLIGSYYNAIMFPLIFVGITSYVLLENKPKSMFAGLFVFGLLYAFCIHCSSNQGFYVISMASAATNIASYIFLGALIKEMQASPDNIEYAAVIKRVSFGLAAFMIFLQGAFQVSVKLYHVFWEGEPSTLTTQITQGPAKGIYTNQGTATEYANIYRDIQDLKNRPDSRVLVLSNKTWIYLALSKPYGTFSAWISEDQPQNIERLKTYSNVNPDHAPKYIYIPKNSKWDFTNLNSGVASYGLTLQETPNGFILENPSVN